MNLSLFTKTVLVVVSVSWVANAQLTPGRVRGSTQYQPGLGQGSGEGWVDPGSGAVDPSPYDPSPYDPVPDYGQRETRSIFVQRNVTNERINIRALAGLDRNYQGYEILAIRGNVRSMYPGRAIVQLMADGRIIATQLNPNGQIYLTPQIRAILGSNVRVLELLVNGSIYIEELEVDLMAPNQGPPPPLPPTYPPYPPQPPYPPEPPIYPNPPGQNQQSVTLNINRSLYGNDRIDLTQYIDLQSYLGYTVDEVVIEGSASNAAISLLVNGNNSGQANFSGNYSESQSIWLSARPVIGRGADSLVLYSSGQINVERVTLILSR